MEITATVKEKNQVKYLQAFCGVRYWEDATVDGVEDEDGDLIPCREGDSWSPLIELETGRIVNWEIGKTADIHYKICDSGVYQLLDENHKIVMERKDYVPKIMSPKSTGYGDYVIMDVDANGFIQNWRSDISDFDVD